MKVKFILDRETKGALLFKEVDAKGAIVQNMYDSSIGSLYLRKTSQICADAHGRWPQAIEVEVRAI